VTPIVLETAPVETAPPSRYSAATERALSRLLRKRCRRSSAQDISSPDFRRG
jgi:hypothetical protein